LSSAWSLGNQLRLECAVTVAGDFDRQFAKLFLQSLAALAISHDASRIIDRLALAMTEVLAHLGL
jgi:hypothetical protein